MTVNVPDYYKALGVSESADKNAIKKAFRSLAKEYHPDRHKGDKTKEARFKEISEAYDILSDDKKRAEYDNIRKYGGFNGGAGGADFSEYFRNRGASGQGFSFNASGFGDFAEIFNSMFGGANPAGGRGRHSGPFGGFGGGKQQSRGADMTSELTISFEESLEGASKEVTLADADKKLKTVRVKIPKGISDGEKIRLKGLGAPGFGGGVNGDLIVTVLVKAHQKFSREGLNILSSVDVPLKTALLGGKVKVDTLTRQVMLNVPPGAQPGAKLRLNGMGLSLNGQSGDHIVTLNVKIPTSLTDDQKKALESL